MNNLIKYSFLIIMLFLLNSMSYAQRTINELHELYNFKPKELSLKDAEVKYKKINALWVEMNADTTYYLPLIRQELLTTTHASYFYFDLSSYLEMYATTSKDRRIIEKAIQQIQWDEIGTWEVAEKLRDFAGNGIDVTSVAFQLFAKEKVKLVNPETKEVFNQGKLMAYILLPAPKSTYLKKLVDALPTVSEESKRTAISLLWLSNTELGNTVLTSIYAPESTYSTDIRAYANRLMKSYFLDEKELENWIELDEVERKQKLIAAYQDLILVWTNESWNQLVLLTKKIHYFSIVID